MINLCEGIDEGTIPGPEAFVHNPDEAISRLAIDLTTSKYELSENWTKRHNIVPGEISLKKDARSTLCRFLLKRVVKEKIKKSGIP